MYVIFGYVDEGDGQPLFWSNDIGWVNLESATKFTEKDTGTLNLPMTGNGKTGVWVKLPK